MKVVEKTYNNFMRIRKDGFFMIVCSNFNRT